MVKIWKSVEGYEGLYEVSSHGDVRSVDRVVKGNRGQRKPLKGKVLSQELMHDGYKRTSLSKVGINKRIHTHRLVAKAFLKRKSGCEYVNHKDEIKSNNHVDNLEWCTQSYNVRYGNGIQKMMSTETYKSTRNEKAVIRVDTRTGEQTEFASMREADRAGFNRKSVGRSIKTGKAFKGYKWELK